MEELFEARFDADPDRRSLGRLCKLLNLRPRGRLDDFDDAQFGHRYLRDGLGQRVSLSMGHRPDGTWTIRMLGMGPPVADELIGWVCAESIDAAERAGMGLLEVRPAGLPRYSPGELLTRLPTREALSVPLSGITPKDYLEVQATLVAALGLRRETGGDSGTERGWRYLRRYHGGVVLLQLLWNWPDTEAEMVVLHDDHHAATPEMLHGMLRQVVAAAAMAGISTPDQLPPHSDTGPTRPAVELGDLTALDQLWERYGVREAHVELRRGILLAGLAAYNSPTPLGPGMLGIERVLPAPGLIHDGLRQEASGFLLASGNLVELPG